MFSVTESVSSGSASGAKLDNTSDYYELYIRVSDRK
jgi:hypothetical protein